MSFRNKPTRETYGDGVQELTRMIAIDPGDVHVGVAFFETWGHPDSDDGWECVDTQEITPEELEDALLETFLDGDVDILVYEKFFLYEDKAMAQVGSEFRTSQLIGVIRYLWRQQEIHASAHDQAREKGKILTCELEGFTCADPKRMSGKHVTLVSQPASIQDPTAGILRARKIKSTAKRNKDTAGHQVSAELHGWYYLLQGRHHPPQSKKRGRR